MFMREEGELLDVVLSWGERDFWMLLLLFTYFPEQTFCKSVSLCWSLVHVKV